MRITVYLRDTVTGFVRNYEDDYEYEDSPLSDPYGSTAREKAAFIWFEGNRSCDCVRGELLWVNEEDPYEELECNVGNNRIRVAIKDNGTILYAEKDWYIGAEAIRKYWGDSGVRAPHRPSRDDITVVVEIGEYPTSSTPNPFGIIGNPQEE